MSRNRRFLRTNTAMLIALVACCALLFGVLRHWRDASPVRETLRRLSDGNATGRLLAARDLGILQAAEAVPALIAALHDPDDRVRSEAIVSLKQHPRQALQNRGISARSLIQRWRGHTGAGGTRKHGTRMFELRPSGGDFITV